MAMTGNFESYLTRMLEYYIDFEAHPKIKRFLHDAQDRSRFSRRSPAYDVYDTDLYGVAAASPLHTDRHSSVLKENDARIGV